MPAAPWPASGPPLSLPPSTRPPWCCSVFFVVSFPFRSYSLASSTLFVVYPVWFISRRGALAAAAGWLLCFLWVLDYLWPLGDQRCQCIHDKAAHTVAIDVRDGGWSGPTR